jgi:hypothetical protein
MRMERKMNQICTMQNLEDFESRSFDCTRKSINLQSGIEVLKVPPPRLNLSTSEDVRREMARVYREARSRLIEPSEATKLVFILTQILRAHEQVVLENRITDLEALQIR